MTKFFLILGVIILGLAGFGWVQSTPNVAGENQTLAGPKIEIAPPSFDFGEINFGQVVNYPFKVKNSGKGILEIKRVATSCACTTAKILKESLLPNEETELLVSYDTAAMGRSAHGLGKQERIIYVRSNDPLNSQITAMIYANVQ